MSEAPLGLPPPIYATSHPQTLVGPQLDIASFLWGRNVQGEVFVKTLGQARGVPPLCAPFSTCTLCDPMED